MDYFARRITYTERQFSFAMKYDLVTSRRTAAAMFAMKCDLIFFLSVIVRVKSLSDRARQSPKMENIDENPKKGEKKNDQIKRSLYFLYRCMI